ncbi:MAG: flagellar motor protein MotB [Alphaproteobacteria bacterium]
MKLKNTDLKKNAWMLSFIDLLSILLAFFILFYSLTGELGKEPKTDIDQEEFFNSYYDDVKKYNNTSLNKLIELNYLKKIIESRIVQANIKIDYHIKFNENKLDILLYSKNIFDQENLNNLANIFFNYLREIFSNIDNQICITYYYNKDANSALNKLFKIQYILENKVLGNIILYVNSMNNTNDPLLSQEYLMISIKDNRI